MTYARVRVGTANLVDTEYGERKDWQGGRNSQVAEAPERQG